jgi:transmembrane 9 superfamily protein 2/4
MTMEISSRMKLLFASFTLLVAVTSASAFAEETSGSVSRAERVRLNKEEAQKYLELRRQGVDEVSHTEEAAAMRNYQLRKKKRKGLLRKKETNLASVLFPGVSAQDYRDNEVVEIFTDMVNSKKTQIPFEFYDLPTCRPPPDAALAVASFRRMRKNLGSRLQGVAMKPSPFALRVKQSVGCTPLCHVTMSGKRLKWMRKLVERQYRIHLTLDQLPILMRSKELNYAVRGYPIGFQAPPSFTGKDRDEFYLYNHLKFTITFQEDASSFDGVRVTGFDVHPVSYQHSAAPDDVKEVNSETRISTCNSPRAPAVHNEPSSYLPLRVGPTGESLDVLYSYEVEWIASELPWADRWDVYLIGSPDDDIHYFAIVNSLMIVLFLTGAIATIMIRTLRKDIAGYNEMQTLEEAQEETGWKLVHADVFRPPKTSPMLLSVFVGTGCQLGMAFLLSMICAMVKLLNPLRKGQTLTALLVLYVLSGSVAGYVSARLYKFCDANHWKLNTLYTAIGLPGALVTIFCILNIFLSFAGAASAVSFLTIVALFALWVCVSIPLVFVGSYLGFYAKKLEVPTKITNIGRSIPTLPWYANPPFSVLLGGILPFGSVCIELFFIMSALWLHQIYYVMGFLLAVLLILTVTCAEVAIVMCYLQLCSEDYQWWWKSFWNCASAGFYLFLYSLWFLSSRLDLVGVMPVVVYLTYMSMISVTFGLFCGSIGVVMCFWFNKTIYGALKVD